MIGVMKSQVLHVTVTLLELAHGVARADTPERRDKRQCFLNELLSVVPVHPITAALALRAGRIDGHTKRMASVSRFLIS